MDQQASASVPSVPMTGGAPPQGTWSVGGAVAFVVAVVGAAMLAALVIHTGYEIWLASLSPEAAREMPHPQDPVLLMSVQVAGQVFELVLIWWLTGIWHKDRAAALGLAPARLAPRHWVGVVLLLFGVKIAATLVGGVVAPSDPRRELGPFVELVTAPDAWLVFLAAVVLAALIEELLFRGVLSRTLESTRLGFWAGAAVANLAFAVLHMQYGLGGQIVIFAVGMTLSWIRAWSGSLWPSIVCHAVNNAVALLAIRAMT